MNSAEARISCSPRGPCQGKWADKIQRNSGIMKILLNVMELGRFTSVRWMLQAARQANAGEGRNLSVSLYREAARVLTRDGTLECANKPTRKPATYPSRLESGRKPFLCAT